MSEIIGKAKKVRELFSGTKYSIDYYQREYKWQKEQIRDLIEDLTSRFLQDYDPEHARNAVAKYGHYFLGAIIISEKDNQHFIVDGQQRLTSLTLLLIYLKNLQGDHPDGVPINELISSVQYGQRTFNMHVEEWNDCLEALFENKLFFDETDKTESEQNIISRYNDIGAIFPDELVGKALPYFIDWLIENVHLVEITAYSDEDAYTIFETMNDRGLSLSPVDMLKGYLLANIEDTKKRDDANRLWKEHIEKLADYGKDVPPDFFKAWLRSQYAESIRERKKGAKPEDFDRIGTEFHRWVRDYQKQIGLSGSPAFIQFINRDFKFYVREYSCLMTASQMLTSGLEHIYYNAQLNFTTQYQLLLAPLLPTDSEGVIRQKFRLVSLYLDILLNRRLWNWHNIGFSTMRNAMFLVTREIRQKTPAELADVLYQRLKGENETFASNKRFSLTQRNREFVQLMLARITDYVEQEAGMASHYLDYTTGIGKKKYEVEHIWANKPERHADEFSQPADFGEYRNRIGGLLLLPKSFNASYGVLSYTDKLPHYNTQNLLTRSLHPQSYEHNPGFLKFVKESGLPFKPYADFTRKELDERQELYCQIAEMVWNPERLLEEMN